MFGRVQKEVVQGQDFLVVVDFGLSRRELDRPPQWLTDFRLHEDQWFSNNVRPVSGDLWLEFLRSIPQAMKDFKRDKRMAWDDANNAGVWPSARLVFYLNSKLVVSCNMSGGDIRYGRAR